MTREILGNYILLNVPKDYSQVYEQLLIRLSMFGEDLIKDCTSTCRGTNRGIFNCWNMFQAACAAYTLGESKKGAFLVNYIINQLRLSCDKVQSDTVSNTFFIGVSSVEPKIFETLDITTIIQNAKEYNVVSTKNNLFKYTQDDLISYICVPVEKIELVCAKFGTDIHNTLWDNENQTGAFRKIENMNFGGTDYTVFFYYSPSSVVDNEIYAVLKNL